MIFILLGFPLSWKILFLFRANDVTELYSNFIHGNCIKLIFLKGTFYDVSDL